MSIVTKIILYMQAVKLAIIKKIVLWHNNKFGQQSLDAAIAQAGKVHTLTGKKMYVLLVGQDWQAVPKQDFKKSWHSNPAMKFRSLQEWQKYLHEYNPISRTIHTAAQ